MLTYLVLNEDDNSSQPRGALAPPTMTPGSTFTTHILPPESPGNQS